MLLAELIREQVLRRTREEVPHAVEVAVGEVAPREDGLVAVKARNLGRDRVAEADPDRQGRARRSARSAPPPARALERELGAKVFLDLQVRVRDSWRRDEGLLDRLGIE